MKHRITISFFYKLLMTYLVALLLPITLIGQQILTDYQKTFENEILQTNSNMVGEISAVIDLKMKELEAIAVNLDVNPVLRPYELTSTTYGKIRAIQALAQYRSTNSFIYELGYYIRGTEYIYTSTSAFEKQSFFRYFFKQPGSDGSEIMELLENCSTPVILPARQTEFLTKEARLLVCLYPLPIQGGQYATAIFFIDENQISNLVKSIFRNMDGSLIIYDGQNKPLVTLPGTKVPSYEEIADNSSTPNMQTRKSFSTIKEISGERTAVNLIRNGYRNFSYVALTPLQQIMAPAYRLNQRFFLTLAMVFVIGVLTILISMMVTYKPLKNLFKKAQKEFGTTSSTRNEIAVIGEILEKMNEDNKLLKSVLQENQQNARLIFLIDLINGMIADKDTLNQRSRLVGVDTENRSAAVIMLYPEEYTSDFYEYLLPEAEEIIRPTCGFYPVHTSGERNVPILLTLPEPAPAYMSLCIDKLKNFFQEQQKTVTIGVGSVYEDPLQAHISYREAMDALGHRFIRGKGLVIPYESLGQLEEQLPWYPKQETDILIKSITIGNEEGIIEGVNSVLAQIQKQKLGIFAARCLCYDLINTVAKVVFSSNINLEILEHQLKDMIRLPETETIQQLSEYLIEFCTQLSKQLTNFGDSRVDEMLNYIDEHYCSGDFSVYSMAEALGISYSYMSRLFSAHTNQSVLEYLTDKRMEFIKQMLVTTDLPIKDIILAAGYNDIPNCSRKFKQREGITLSQYRERNRKPDQQTDNIEG